MDATQAARDWSSERIVEETSRLSGELSSLTGDLDQAIEQAIVDIEDLSRQITEIDVEIKTAKHRGQSPNQLLDQRGQVLRDLAELIDVEVDQQVNFELEEGVREDFYRLGGGFLAFSSTPMEIETTLAQDGSLLISRVGSDREFSITSGRLGGLLSARNDFAKGIVNQLDEFANGLVTRLDTIHATGVGLGDGFANIVGRRTVEDITVPLGQLETIAPIEAGSLFVSVVDSNGMESMHEIVVDPLSQSASDLAAAISGVPHLSAVISAETGRLNIAAQSGYQFSFTGRLPTDLSNTSSIAGTFLPNLSGAYSGPENMDVSFRFSGSGDIGVTAGLTLEVLNASGGVIDTFDVGLGYGSTDLRVAEGVNLSLSPGTVVAGDTFSTAFVAEPDTTNALAAFGINTLFMGTEVGDYAVNMAILDDTSLLAVRNFGEPLDTSKKMLEVRDEKFLANGTQTVHEFLTNMITGVGTDTVELIQSQENLSAAGDALAAKEQGLSGVDPNEEMVRMLQYQRAFQAASRYIATVEDALDELFNIIR
ncbi:flagellar basal body rod C-terminal domain-containing protein [Planctomycetota bacterium]